MNPYIFCLIINICVFMEVSCISWLIWKGASPWLIVVAFFCLLLVSSPGKEHFTCPRCGHTGELKVFKIGFDSTSILMEYKDKLEELDPEVGVVGTKIYEDIAPRDGAFL